MTRFKALIQKLSYFYIVSRQEETRFTRFKSNEKNRSKWLFFITKFKTYKNR